jgi:8-oxo-dGTP diphosphatase
MDEFLGARKQLAEVYGNKVRLRVCGLLIEDNRVLLVKHLGLGQHGELWSPPGGGVEFGEGLASALRREFLEETHLQVEVDAWQFVYEYIHPPLHTVECFFKVEAITPLSQMKLGIEPESGHDFPGLVDIRFWTLAEIQAKGTAYFHGLFSRITTFEDLAQLRHFTSVA